MQNKKTLKKSLLFNCFLWITGISLWTIVLKGEGQLPDSSICISFGSSAEEKPMLSFNSAKNSKASGVKPNEDISKDSASAMAQQNKTDENPSLSKSNASCININTADSTMLETLPGIGPVLVQRILEHRKKVGRFKNSRDLLRIKGIGEKKLLKIKPYICF